jgi:hypothetical protein
VVAAPEVSADDSAKDAASSSKPVPKSKLQLKMEAAKLRKQEAEAQKKEADGAAGEPVASSDSNLNAKKSDVSNSAPPEASAAPPEAKAKVPVPTREEQKKRVFNMGDEGWQDASVPGSLAGGGDDGPISDIGPDGKKLSKKEIKKVQRDREIRQKDQVHLSSCVRFARSIICVSIFFCSSG